MASLLRPPPPAACGGDRRGKSATPHQEPAWPLGEPASEEPSSGGTLCVRSILLLHSVPLLFLPTMAKYLALYVHPACFRGSTRAVGALKIKPEFSVSIGLFTT